MGFRGDCGPKSSILYSACKTNNAAKGDNATDDTRAFQTALDTAFNASGGTVYAPPGLFRFTGSLDIKAGVTLQGSFTVVPSHDVRDGQWIEDGTVLLPTGSHGVEAGPPFIHVGPNGAVAGLVVFYFLQPRNAQPVPYPYTVRWATLAYRGLIAVCPSHIPPS